MRERIAELISALEAWTSGDDGPSFILTQRCQRTLARDLRALLDAAGHGEPAANYSDCIPHADRFAPLFAVVRGATDPFALAAALSVEGVRDGGWLIAGALAPLLTRFRHLSHVDRIAAARRYLDAVRASSASTARPAR